MIIKDLNGIVFNVFNYQENDLIVDVFSQELGFIQLFVRGGQKTTSKSFFVFNKFNIINFDLSKYNLDGLSTYKSGSITKAFNFTNLSYEKINAMMYLEELLEKMKHDKLVSKSYYQILIAIINNLTSNEFTHLYLLNYLLIHTLKILGCNITLDCCFYCGNKHGIKVFDYEANGFVCEKCLENAKKITNKKEELMYLYNLNSYIKCDIMNSDVEKIVYKYLSNLLFENAGIYLISQKYIL